MMVWVLRVTPGSAQISTCVLIRTDAGQRQRHRHVDVGGEAGDGLARAAGEHAQRLFQPVHRQAALDQQRRAGKAGGRLARDDA